MTNEEEANVWILKIELLLRAVRSDIDILDEASVNSLEYVHMELHNLCWEIEGLKETTAQIMMLESMFEL